MTGPTAYTPTTDQPITNYIPVLETASTHEPRFDHDPVTGESKGLLIEEQRTNKTPYSQSFLAGPWSGANNRLSAYNRNSAIGPDGTVTALQIKEDTQNGQHYIQYNDSYNSGQTYTWSVHLKADGRDHAILTLHQDAFGNQVKVLFDLTNGSASVISGSPDSFQSQDVGNGWYRCSVTATATTDNNSVNTRITLSDGIGNSYQGDGFSGILVWGAQLEEGSFPTSYIKTEGSQVTRTADSASISGSNFSEWYRQDEGTVFVEYDHQTDRLSGGILRFLGNGGVSDNHISFRSANGKTRLWGFIKYNGDGVLNFNNVTGINDGINKAAFAFGKNDSALSVTDYGIQEDFTVTVPKINELQVGVGSFNASNTQISNTTIKRLTYYPKRLPNAVLQALTKE